MTGWRKRTIIEMAREAGFEQVGHDSFQELTARMEAFANLVRADEREACAKAADQYMRDCEGKSFCVGTAIRARGEQA